MAKSEVVAKMGTPFRTDTHMEGEKHIDVLYYYKENLRVGVTPYDVTTTLLFEDEILKSIKQDDKLLQENSVKVDVDKK